MGHFIIYRCENWDLFRLKYSPKITQIIDGKVGTK